MTTKRRPRAGFLGWVFRASLMLVPALFVGGVLRAQSMGEAGDFGFVQPGGGTFSSTLTVPAGAVGAPALNFTGFTTTGFFASAGPQLHIAVSGSDLGYFSSAGWISAGLLGIGSGNSYLQSPSSGVVKISDNGDSSFARLMLGCTDTSCGAIKKSGTTVAFRLADDSADAPITASNATLSGTMTSSRTSDIGWSVVAVANQIGTTTCTSACVLCFDTSAGSVLKNCSDATADICVCAGAS